MKINDSRLLFFKTVHQRAVHDLKRKFLGTIMGSIWAILNPLIRFSAYAFAVQVGFRSNSIIDGHNFLPWLIVALGAWFFVSESLPAGAKSLISNKVLLESSPHDSRVYIFSTILSIVYANMLFYVVVIFLYIPFFNYWISLDSIMFLYYYLSLVIFLISISLITSVLSVYIRDISNLLSAITTFLFWFTPILYPVQKLIDHNVGFLATFNPFYYCISGIRNALLHDFEIRSLFTVDTIVFWSYVLITFVLGTILYNRTKKQIIDVI